MQTELDKFEPKGARINVTDLIELLEALPVDARLVKVANSPAAVDAADYLRNRHDVGFQMTVNDEPYFIGVAGKFL